MVKIAQHPGKLSQPKREALAFEDARGRYQRSKLRKYIGDNVFSLSYCDRKPRAK